MSRVDLITVYLVTDQNVALVGGDQTYRLAHTHRPMFAHVYSLAILSISVISVVFMAAAASTSAVIAEEEACVI